MLNNLEDGTLSSSGLETLLAGAAGKADLQTLLSNSVLSRRTTSSVTAMGAIKDSATAFLIFLRQPISVGRGINTISLISSTDFLPIVGGQNSFESILDSVTAANEMFSSTNVMAEIAKNTTAMTYIKNSPSGFDAFLNGTKRVGKGLETIAGITNTTLAGLNTMAEVFANSTAMAAVAGSTTVMGLILGSATHRANLYASAAAMTIVGVTTISRGLIIASTTYMTYLANSTVGLTNFVSGFPARTALYNSGPALAILEASSTAKATLLSLSTLYSQSHLNNPDPISQTTKAGILLTLSSEYAASTYVTAAKGGGSINKVDFDGFAPMQYLSVSAINTTTVMNYFITQA